MRALLSVSDKRDLIPFAKTLVSMGYSLIASGGTARTLRDAGLPVMTVESVTGFPEILGGRVKTLHPVIHGGILAQRDDASLQELEQHHIQPIDLVVVNLYPFEDTVTTPGISLENAIEHIDIGGVALLRAAAKNFMYVTVVCDPEDYGWVGNRLQQGGLSLQERRQLAVKAFQHTAAYDAAIATYLSTSPDENVEDSIQKTVAYFFKLAQPLRYGENPHQTAGLFVPIGQEIPFVQLHGKAMSYNNWLDLDAAWRAAQDFDTPAVAIIKHGNPCGLATDSQLHKAYKLALNSDPISAFGSVIAVNRPLDAETATAMSDLFIEVLAAPEFTPEALRILQRKSKNIRLLKGQPRTKALLWRTTVAGWLAQTPDEIDEARTDWKVVTTREPTEDEWEALQFAWRAVKHVKSNAIVLAQGRATVGVGAGQMSRVDAVRIAIRKAQKRAQGAVLASDAFFPFPDGVEVAAQAGVTAIIQPGGSKRDSEVIAAANRLGLAMVFTGVRHFRH